MCSLRSTQGYSLNFLVWFVLSMKVKPKEMKEYKLYKLLSSTYDNL